MLTVKKNDKGKILTHCILYTFDSCQHKVWEELIVYVLLYATIESLPQYK